MILMNFITCFSRSLLSSCFNICDRALQRRIETKTLLPVLDVYARSQANSPIWHFVEVFCEFGQIRWTLLTLLLRPNQNFGNFNFLEQFGIEKCHLFCNIGRFQIQQRRLACDHTQNWIDWGPFLLLEHHDLVQNIVSQQFGHHQLTRTHQLINKFVQQFQNVWREIGGTANESNYFYTN